MTTYSLKPLMRWWWGKQTKGTLSMFDFLDYCARLGLDAAEITAYFFEQPLPPTRMAQLRRHAHLLGLDISGGAIGNNFSFASDSEQFRYQVKTATDWIQRFSELGAPVMRVFAGRPKDSSQTPEATIANVVATLETLLPIAERNGIMLGVENHDFANNIDYLLAILQAIDSDWLGVIWDSANLIPTPDPYTELARIAPYAITAQIKVMTKLNGKDTPADYARLLQILRDAHYRGYIVFEYEEHEPADSAIPPHIARLRNLIG